LPFPLHQQFMPTAAGLLTAPGQIGAQQPPTAHNFLAAAAQMQTPGIPANSLQLLQQQAQQQLSAGTSNASISPQFIYIFSTIHLLE
jgi:hypothetical protein